MTAGADTRTDDAEPARRAEPAEREGGRLARWLALRPDPRRAPLEEQVVFHFNLGFGLDGGDPSSDAKLLNEQVLSEPDYARLRLYYFGNAIVGSRGLIAPSLSSYVATQFRLDQGGRNCLAAGQAACANAIPSARDGRDVNDLFIHSAYGQLDGFFKSHALAPLFVRAGRQYRYGPATAHFDGLTIGYETQTISLGAFLGSAVDLYGFPITARSDGGAGITGLDAYVAVYERWHIPLVWSISTLSFDKRDHLATNIGLQWSRDVAIRAGLRTLDGKMARTSLQVRARISPVTTVNFEAENRTAADWMYDLYTIDRNTDTSDPRRYLDFGPPLPRLYATLRAGTVLLRNVDVLIRGGAALEHADDGVAPSPHAASFLEGGGAVELRPRRAIAVALSGLLRRYAREPDLPANSNSEPDPLPTLTGSAGERSFAEGGASVRYTQGARRLTARAELYVRYLASQSAYDGVALDTPDFRLGGRFGAEIWPSDRLRLKAEYDVSSRIELAPELRGFKSLRVVAEGRF